MNINLTSSDKDYLESFEKFQSNNNKEKFQLSPERR